MICLRSFSAWCSVPRKTSIRNFLFINVNRGKFINIWLDWGVRLYGSFCRVIYPQRKLDLCETEDRNKFHTCFNFMCVCVVYKSTGRIDLSVQENYENENVYTPSVWKLPSRGCFTLYFEQLIIGTVYVQAGAVKIGCIKIRFASKLSR